MMTKRPKILLACAAVLGLAAGGVGLAGSGGDAQAYDGSGKRFEGQCAQACGHGPHGRFHRGDRHHGDFHRHHDHRKHGKFRHGGHHGGFVAKLFERYDVDDTGRIKVEDILTIRSDELKKFDKNGDGQLDLQEYEALWLERMRERMVRSFQRFDRDGDAQVTVEEFNRPMQRLAKRLDRNKDGVIEKVDRRGGKWDRDGRGKRRTMEHRPADQAAPAQADESGSTDGAISAD